MFYLYALYNQDRKKIYIGQTNNLTIRLKRHNGELPSKKGSFTSINNGSWILIYKEEHLTRKEAVVREKQLKTQKGREFIWNIIENR